MVIATSYKTTCTLLLIQILEQLVDTILVAWTFVKLSIGHPNDSIGELNGGIPFGGRQKKVPLGICVSTSHHWLNAF